MAELIQNPHDVDESVVRAIPAPAWTKTWHPTSHGQVLDATEAAIGNAGIGIVSKHFSLSKTGTRLFGTYDLDIGNGEMGYMLGVRQATDKSMGLAFVSGTRVFLCSNGMISGDFISFRMHTAGLDFDSLTLLADEALAKAVVSMHNLHAWHKSLHNYYVPSQDYKAFVYDMVAGGVISGGQIGNYEAALMEEKAIRRGRSLDCCNSLFNLHGAATRLMRTWSQLRSADACARLQLICNKYMDDRNV